MKKPRIYKYKGCWWMEYSGIGSEYQIAKQHGLFAKWANSLS